MNSIDVIVKPADLESPPARALIGALNAELSAIYPEQGATHFRLDREEVAEGRGVFVIAWSGDTPVGCGAVRRIAGDTGELKRMYVVPTERGRGVGRVLLTALEHEAARLGFARVVLETGTRQAEAIKLYERAGFERTDRFGEYARSPLSLCMEKVVAR